MPAVALAATAAHYTYQRRAARKALEAAQAAWATVTVGNLDASWAGALDRLVAVVTAAQLAAARDADPYLAAVLAEQGVTDAPMGQVQPAGFAGLASDGRPLDSLFAEPVIGVKQDIGQGAPAVEALTSGGLRLQMLAQTMVQDVGRLAVHAGMLVRPNVTGYVRVLTPPSCSRCAILAGRWYRKNAGFRRHPRCDCRAQPASEGDAPSYTTNPYEAFARGEVRGLSTAEEKAISDGGDIAQVVNARRGRAGQGMTTAEGTTKRGLAGSRLKGRQRLTVDAIAGLASTDAEWLKLLKAHGYVL